MVELDGWVMVCSDALFRGYAVMHYSVHGYAVMHYSVDMRLVKE